MNLEYEVFSEVVGFLEKLSLDYFITGSIAKVYYSSPRMTRDMDVVINLPSNQRELIDNFISIFSKDYYVDRTMIENSIKEKLSFNIIHNKKLVKVDFIIYQSNPFEESKLTRRNRVNLFGLTCWMISLEDLVLSKLEWAKNTESEIQLRDVSELIQANQSIDQGYLLKWVTNLGLESIYSKVNRVKK